MHTGIDFWKNYMDRWFGNELIAEWNKNVKIEEIQSINGPIHIEVYKTDNINNPTLVFSHGIAGYARLLIPFLMPLYKLGYNIIAPDLEGYGYNKRVKGNFTWNEHLVNLKDTVEYARKNFTGKVFLGGASMGGPLAYACDARYNLADGLICWCLWDFSDKEFMRKETNTKKMTFALLPICKLLSKLIGKIRLKTYTFISYDTLTDDKEFNDLVKIDPHAGTLISFRGIVSLLTQSKPDILHNAYNKPVLLCQPNEDKMTPVYYMKKTFDNIKCKDKKYVDFPGPHFPVKKETYGKWAKEVDAFIKEIERT
ncbi:MAG: alpha/beta hydrolase [Treponema sp.]